MDDETFLYLITTGRKTGQPREIEIWFVAHERCYYLCAEHRERAHWVQNIQQTPQIQFRLGTRDSVKDAAWQDGRGRVVDAAAQPDLHAAVSRLFDEKYEWSDGLLVELCPLDATRK